jgi:hypothetical protein
MDQFHLSGSEESEIVGHFCQDISWFLSGSLPEGDVLGADYSSADEN